MSDLNPDAADLIIAFPKPGKLEPDNIDQFVSATWEDLTEEMSGRVE